MVKPASQLNFISSLGSAAASAGGQISSSPFDAKR